MSTHTVSITVAGMAILTDYDLNQKNFVPNIVKAGFYFEGTRPEARIDNFSYTHTPRRNKAFNVPAAAPITVDGDLSDWSASTDWSDPFTVWNGPGRAIAPGLGDPNQIRLEQSRRHALCGLPDE